MLRRELENKIQKGQLTDLIKGLRSKHLEIIAPVEPNIQNTRKSEIFMLQHINQQELKCRVGKLLLHVRRVELWSRLTPEGTN